MTMAATRTRIANEQKLAFSEYMRGYYQENKERLKKQALAYYHAHRDEINARRREEYKNKN